MPLLSVAGVRRSRVDKRLTTNSTACYCRMSSTFSGHCPERPRFLPLLQGNHTVVKCLQRVCRTVYFGSLKQSAFKEIPPNEHQSIRVYCDQPRWIHCQGERRSRLVNRRGKHVDRARLWLPRIHGYRGYHCLGPEYLRTRVDVRYLAVWRQEGRRT